jgi:hypothetical protein
LQILNDQIFSWRLPAFTAQFGDANGRSALIVDEGGGRDAAFTTQLRDLIAVSRGKKVGMIIPSLSFPFSHLADRD